MRKLNLKKSFSFVTLATAAVILPAVAIAAVTFGPSRPTYTWANPADHITFNSITDNPVVGDERQLLKVRDINSPTTAYATSATVTDNEEVVLEVYFHNNAASNLNLVAQNTKVNIALPNGTASTQTATAYINATNATPTQVFATADMSASAPFTLTYEPGTAKLYTNYVNGIQISDAVVNGGTLIGTNGADGNVPGCSQYSGYVTIRARVHVPTTPTPPTQTPTPTTPTPTPAKPKALPNTGAGDVLGIFTGASAVGGVGHYFTSRRRK